METTFINVTTDNDTKVNADTLSADGCCPYKAECTIPEQPEVVGFFPLSGRSYPKLTPADKITAVPPDRKYAEVFSEGIAVVEMRKSSALKICSILDRSGLHYRAVASKSKARLYFQNRNIQDMEIQLDRLKQAKYYNTTKNKMIQDLICLGLESIQHKTDASGQQGTSAANGTRAEP